MSEPLTKCRNEYDGVKTGGFVLIRDKSGGNLPYCPVGVRHKGGVNFYQASVWNVGTCRPDAKGEIR